TPQGEDYREGLTAVVSIAVPEPQFESQTKIRLNNPEVDGIVSSVVYEYLMKYLEENPKEAKKIMNKVIIAAQAREAATKAKKAMKDRKSMLSGGGLPGKLWIALPAIEMNPSSSSSKGKAPAAPPTTAGNATSRPSCPCAAKSSTSRRPASRKSSATTSS